MNIQIGVDMTPVEKIKGLFERDCEFVKTLFTPIEMQYAEGKRGKYEHLAARFAAKEAAIKAFSVVNSTKMLRVSDIEIQNHPITGKPLIHLSQEGEALNNQLGITSIDVSLSHTKWDAIATVVILMK